MPLAREIEYWDHVAGRCRDEHGVVMDNVWKRPGQVRRLLKYEWIGSKVLEIGTGNAMVAGSLKLIAQGNFEYVGTELSSVFRMAANKMFQLETVEADVRELPGEEYTRIIALDSLEHVRPEHRAEGYAKIASVAAKDALLFIHYSHSTSYHDKEFDHPFGLTDLCALEETGFRLRNFDRYDCFNGKSKEYLDYAFVVMQK